MIYELFFFEMRFSVPWVGVLFLLVVVQVNFKTMNFFKNKISSWFVSSLSLVKIKKTEYEYERVNNEIIWRFWHFVSQLFSSSWVITFLCWEYPEELYGTLRGAHMDVDGVLWSLKSRRMFLIFGMLIAFSLLYLFSINFTLVLRLSI